MAIIRIGTSGWNYKHWHNQLYPPEALNSHLLLHYRRFFNTVEINNSFYRMPSAENFSIWKDLTQTHFQFAVKANRWFTHMKKLKDVESDLDDFMFRVSHLGEKLGPILFQFPPFWGINLERLESFIKMLPKLQRFAFEFRNKSWHHEEVYDLLRIYNKAFCIYDIGGFESPRRITADFIYIRLHGPTEHAYLGNYSIEQLQSWADQIKAWDFSREIYVYFDNDHMGNAPKNAYELKKLLNNGTKFYTFL